MIRDHLFLGAVFIDRGDGDYDVKFGNTVLEFSYQEQDGHPRWTFWSVQTGSPSLRFGSSDHLMDPRITDWLNEQREAHASAA